MKKERIIIFGGLLITTAFFVICYFHDNFPFKQVPNNYLYKFENNIGDNIYSTYIYKGKKKGNFEYINTTYNIGNDITEEQVEIVSKGTIKKKDLFNVAKEHNSLFYVLIKGDYNVYDIDSFKEKIGWNYE